MGLVYDAKLTPSKQELIDAWLPQQPFYRGTLSDPLQVVAAYRFDDPAEQVGLQVHVVRGADGTLYQVPMTYRGETVDADLIGEMEHSVLGHRYVYDGRGDSVFVTELTRAAVTGAKNVDEWREDADGTRHVLPRSIEVTGTGTGTGVGTDEQVELRVVIDPAETADDTRAQLLGDWGQGPHLLAG